MEFCGRFRFGMRLEPLNLGGLLRGAKGVATASHRMANGHRHDSPQKRSCVESRFKTFLVRNGGQKSGCH